ncbi:MAG: hypothetical protein KDE33_14605 [Bacteroidetes bacterium]|nr:hypothetical protein [Bacteroidota bacterium]
MKKAILTLTITLAALISYGQCNCEKINRDDGSRVTQCSPLPVAYDNTTQVGLAAASNGQDKFVTITIRFKSTAKDIVGNLSIRLEDNNLITFELVNSGLSLIGNSQVAQGVFLANETDIAKLKKSGIKTISFKLNDGLLRTYQATSNADILKKQVICL